MSGLLRPRAADRASYFNEDTIGALASATGGPLAVIRVSGPAAMSALEALSEPGILNDKELRKLYRVQLKSREGTALDDALFAYFKAPASFTGEDALELHIHGGPFGASRVLEQLFNSGVRPALPGEFSFRAVRNGKMTLSQAEAVSDLIAASNDGAIELALEKMSGTQSRFVLELAEELRMLASLGEIGIDFSDQDVDEVSLSRLKKRVEPIHAKLSALESSFQRGMWIQEGIRVAFIGLPNAGKSSFFNALLGEDRSIVSDVPGTTRDVVREKLTLQGTHSTITLKIEDTAGLRHSSDQVERLGIARTQKSAKEADLLLLLVDASQIEASLPKLREQWKEIGEPRGRTLGFLTQVDRIDSGQGPAMIRACQERLSELGIDSWPGTSAVTGAGIAEASRSIAAFCEKWVKRNPGEILLTRHEHLIAVQGALEALSRAENSVEIDLFAADLKQALFALAPLIGDTVPDDILGRIFSKFCIGK